MNLNAALGFSGVRREPLLDQASFDYMLQYLERQSIPKLASDLAAGRVSEENIGHAWYDLGSKYLNVTILKYSGGEAIAPLAATFDSAVAAFNQNVECEFTAMDAVDLAVQTYYVEALWLLSLAKLLGRGDEALSRVASLYAADETNDGADELFELILAKLGRKSYEAEGLIHEDPYQLLLDCIKAEPDERPALMTQFLKRWFKGQEECDWWGMHINRTKDPILKNGFFGYWAFEAALVTYLWDIDDSSYRDLPHYPKDLIDYARQNASAPTPVDPLTGRAQAGQPCPREGWWSTPAKADSRRHFKQGEVMPEVAGDYGATIWQWDSSQEA